MKTRIFDAHMINLFRDCEEKYNKRINQLLVSKEPNGALGSGIAFHEAGAAYRQLRKAGNSIEEAFNGGLYSLRKAYLENMPSTFIDPLAVCPDERRSLPSLERVFEGFVNFEETQRFTYHYIEQSFAINLGTLSTQSGDTEVLYVGIVDALIEQQGCLFVNDIKTTTMNISQNYKDSFRLSQALKGYQAGISALTGKEVYGSMISLVWFQKESKSGKAKPINEYFHIVPITYTSEQLDEWRNNTLGTIRRIINAEETGEWEMAFGSACSNYSGCTFREICWSTPSSRQRIAEMDFKRRTWSPLEEVRSREVSDEEWKKWLTARTVGDDE